jgi:hypothetical protein
LSLPDVDPISLSAEVARDAAPASQRLAQAITFRDVSAECEDEIHKAVLRALERQHEPSVLVVHSATRVLGAIAHDLNAIRRRAILAFTPLDAVRWLCSLEANIDVALIERSFQGIDGVEVLSFIREEMPQIRRVLMCPEPVSEGGLEGEVHAVLARPWTRDRLEAAIGAP